MFGKRKKVILLMDGFCISFFLKCCFRCASSGPFLSQTPDRVRSSVAVHHKSYADRRILNPLLLCDQYSKRRTLRLVHWYSTDTALAQLNYNKIDTSRTVYEAYHRRLTLMWHVACQFQAPLFPRREGDTGSKELKLLNNGRYRNGRVELIGNRNVTNLEH